MAESPRRVIGAATSLRHTPGPRPIIGALLFLPCLVLIAAAVFGLWAGLWLLFTGDSFAAFFRFVTRNSLPPNLILAVAGLVATLVMQRIFTRRDRGQNVLRFDRASLRYGLTGLALGVGAQTLVALLGAATGAYLFRWNWDISHLGPWLLYFGTMFLVAFQEEAMLRGFMLTSLSSSIGRVPAAIALSVLFGVLHLNQPNVGWMAIVGLTAHGLVFVYSVLSTGHIWQAVGMHMMWNVCEAAVYGFPNSGVSVPFALWTVEARGPEWWTGGKFGPEAGLISLLCLGATLLGMRYLNQRYRTPLDDRRCARLTDSK